MYAAVRHYFAPQKSHPKNEAKRREKAERLECTHDRILRRPRLYSSNPHSTPPQRHASERARNPHPDVVNNPPKSLDGESGIDTQGLALYYSTLNVIFLFYIVLIKCMDV
jgi:hypothetical protein